MSHRNDTSIFPGGQPVLLSPLVQGMQFSLRLIPPGSEAQRFGEIRYGL